MVTYCVLHPGDHTVNNKKGAYPMKVIQRWRSQLLYRKAYKPCWPNRSGQRVKGEVFRPARASPQKSNSNHYEDETH